MSAACVNEQLRGDVLAAVQVLEMHENGYTSDLDSRIITMRDLGCLLLLEGRVQEAETFLSRVALGGIMC